MMTHIVHSFSRRATLSLMAASVAAPAVALSSNEAEQLVFALVNDINDVINSGKSENRMFSDFEKLFARYGDVPTIARTVLGVDGRGASSGDIRAFTKAYQTYVSRKYGRRFREFIGGKLEVKGSRAVKRRNRTDYEVVTTAFLRGEAPFEVTFFVADVTGRDKFYNMTIEGVNMLLTERTEIGAILDRNGGSIKALIQDIKQR